MREIKFRAWIPKSKEMLYHGSIIDCWGYWWLVNGGLYNAIPMQYTGLKDKNGKEIYEGDTLETDKGVVFLVIWSPKSARWVGITRNIWTDKPYVGKYIYKSLPWLAERGEVIGNIYENKELLEVT